MAEQSTRTRVGTLLRHYREYAGLSQRALTEKSGVEQSNISNIESGNTPTPQDATLERLAVTLAQVIPNADPTDIYDRLVEAKENRATTKQMPPAVESVADRLMVLDERYMRHAVNAIHALLDTLDKFYKMGQGRQIE